MNSQSVLEIFKEITKIPRESGFEAPMTEYLQKFAAEHRLECKTDEIGNVLIVKPASKGKENVPTIVLQAHQDMVCEKNVGVKHDFRKDPIKYIIKDGWMIAPETTLGADDGIGIAAILDVLNSDLETGRIEGIFTINEESGMDGAFGMKEGFFTGRTLINLDSEEEGLLYIGCAGGLNTFITVYNGREDLKEGFKPLELKITGARGGHSGDEINKDRMNTIQTMTRFLFTQPSESYQLISFNAGNKPNAITRECITVVAVSDVDDFSRKFEEFGRTTVSQEFFVTDPDAVFTATPVETETKPLDSKTARDLVCALLSMPHGVQSMSQTVPGLVETSSNLASVKMISDSEIQIVTSQRSAIKAARQMMSDRIEAAFNNMNCKVEKEGDYPGWTPNPESAILKTCVESYRRLFNQEPTVLAVHAGLECGLFGEKFGDLDMISFGPTLVGVHAPGEKLELASLDRFVEHLVDVICNFR